MKRLWLLGVTVLTSLTLGGCPLYPDEAAQCSYNSDCSDGYVCDYPSGACVPRERDAECTSPSQCGVNQSCGADQRCHPGDCSFVGCPAGFSCMRSGMRFSCEDTLSSSGGSAGTGASGASGGTATGGAAGAATGGAAGTATGGAAGAAAGGAAGAAAGGAATGGAAGAATGGAAAGGAAGAATGGAAAGGAAGSAT